MDQVWLIIIGAFVIRDVSNYLKKIYAAINSMGGWIDEQILLKLR